ISGRTRGNPPAQMDRVGKGRARHRLRAGADGLDHQAPLKLAQKPPGRRFKLNGHRTDQICSFNAAPRGGEGKYENETHHANRLRPAERVRVFIFPIILIVLLILLILNFYFLEDKNDDEHEEDFTTCLKPPWFLMPSPSSARSCASRTRLPSATSTAPRSCSSAFRSAAII